MDEKEFTENIRLRKSAPKGTYGWDISITGIDPDTIEELKKIDERLKKEFPNDK